MKFSNLVRYVFTGGCVVVIVLLFLHLNVMPITVSGLSGISSETGMATIMVMLVVAVIYFIGVIFFGFRLWISRFDLFSKLYAGKRRTLAMLFFPYVMLDVNHLCIGLKYFRKAHNNLPHWIYLVDRPDTLLDSMVDYTFKVADEDVDDEMKYMNETAVALIFILYLTLFAQLVTFAINIVSGKDIQTDVLHAMIVLVVLIALLSMVAYTFAIKFLMKLGNMEKVCKDAKNISNMSFVLNQYPTAFVLIRTTTKSLQKDKIRDNTCLKEALCSVARQDYPNIKVLVLDDVLNKKGSKTKEVIEEYKRIELKRRGRRLSISYDMEICNGAAGAAYSIRELFLTIANERDVAIMLDDDDTLRHDCAITDIMVSMNMRRADICLCSFETTEDKHLNICNKGGKTHNAIVKSLEEQDQVFGRNIVMASSMGWTKAYSYNQVEKYNEYILKTSLKSGNALDIYKDIKRYEDFPDILVLASSVNGKLPRITGVSTPTHNYTKREGAITTTPKKEDFLEARPKFLALTLNLAFVAEEKHNSSVLVNSKEKWMLSSENTLNIIRFVLYKTLQISNILMGNKKKAEEEGDSAWDEFKDVKKDAFYKALLEELKNTVDIDSLKNKLQILIQPQSGDCNELSLDELLIKALTRMYEENKNDIDIKNLK